MHGFLTVDGEKMSKSRGTFIRMATYAKHLDPDYVRYYYASKLGPGVDDLDLNFADFTAKANADLVGKLVNIASRCAGFVHRLNDGMLAAELPDRALFDEFAAAATAIAEDYEGRDYARAVRRIMALADRANQYIDERKPWVLAKNPKAAHEVIAVCTLGLNLFRTLIVFLKPIIPGVAERAEKLLGGEALTWSAVERPLLGRRIERFEPLLQRVEEEATRKIVDEREVSGATTSVGIAAKPLPRERSNERDRPRSLLEDRLARGAHRRGEIRRWRRQAARAYARPRERRAANGICRDPKRLRSRARSPTSTSSWSRI